MHPTILRFGNVELHSYGLLLAIAFLVGIQLFLKRGIRRGLPEERLSTLALILLVLAIIGGRALFVLTHWNEYASDPAGVFRIWEGGLMLYGGYLLAIGGGIAYLRRVGLPIWRVGDAAAPSMALGIGIGRLGCFLNGCCFGTPTDVPWAVRFPSGSYSNFIYPGQPLHPSQLYLAAAGAVLFALLLAWDRKPRFDGWLFWTYIAIDASARFFIDFTRYYDETSFLGRLGGLSFNVNQILSVFLVLAAAFMLRRLSRAGAATHPADASAPADLRVDAGEPEPAPRNPTP